MRLQLVHILLILQIIAAAYPSRAIDTDARSKEEIKRRRASVEDFYVHRKKIADEERDRDFGSETAARRREIDDEIRERTRQAYVRLRVRRNTAEIERLEREDEKRIEREKQSRDRLRQNYVRYRNRVLRTVRQSRKIDPDLEFDLQDRDRNRVKPLKGSTPTPPSGDGQ